MSVQLIIIIVYFILTVLIGVLSGRKTKSAAAFTGVALSTFAIVCASTGEWLGGTATTGVSEYGFLYGLSGWWYTIANGIGVLFLGLLFAKLFRSLETGTVPGIIEKFFGLRARTVSCVILTIVMLAVGLSQMIAAGKLGESLLGIPFWISAVIFAVIFIIYTLAGGMNAVASTNVMHLVVMYVGVIVAVIVVVTRVGGLSEFKSGVDTLQAQGSGGSFWNMFSIGGSKVSSWIIASLLGACTAQAGLQPVLSSRNAKQARKACIITAFVAAPFGFFTAFLGMASRVMYVKDSPVFDAAQEKALNMLASGEIAADQVVNKTMSFLGDSKPFLTSVRLQALELFSQGNITAEQMAGKAVSFAGKSALPELMMNQDIMSPIVGGLVLAAILAAVLSTVSPIILASGTMVTRDVYQRVLHPEASDEQVLKMGRITTAISGVICCVGAIFLWKASAVLELVYAAYSLRGALFVVVLFGIYWKKSSQKGAICAMICTAVAAVAWVAIKLATGSYPLKFGSFAVSETYIAVVVAAICTIIFSLVFKPTALEQAEREQTKKALREAMANA